MKGLLLKDIFLLKEIRKMLALCVIVTVLLLVGGVGESFVLGYFNILVISSVMNTLSYDDNKNGLAYLVLLPTGKKNYVKSKYVFGSLLCSGGWVLSVVITSISLGVKGTTDYKMWAIIWCIYLVMIFVVLSVTLPFMLKYGSEKGRTAMIVFMACIFLLVFAGDRFIEAQNIDLGGAISKFLSLGWFVGVIGIVAALAGMFISCKISCSILEKREF